MIEADPSGKWVTACRSRARSDPRVEVRCGERHAHTCRNALRLACRRAMARVTLRSIRTVAGSTRIQEEGSTVVLFDFDAANRTPHLTSDDLQPAARLCRQQFLLRDPRLRRRALRLCRKPPPRQHRHLRHRRGWHAQLCDRGMDAGRLPRSFTFDPTG
jgi:hypothetical protein